MSSMRDLLEKMGPFAGEKVGQKPGDQVRGSEPMPKKGGYKKHPYAGRLVGGGAAESVEDNKSFEETLKEEYSKFVAEYGAPGSAISSKQQGQDPMAYAASQQEKKAQKDQIQSQAAGLEAQVAGERSQVAQLNRSFPQGANPVEKAMALKDMNSQRVQLGRQIEDQMQQIAALRSQLQK